MQEQFIHIHARTLDSVHQLVVGPALYFEIEGSALYQGPDREAVGCYRRPYWEIFERALSSFECTEPTIVEFQDASQVHSERFGPFANVHFPNGSCYADGRHLAEFIPEIERWVHRNSGARWSTIMLLPAPT